MCLLSNSTGYNSNVETQWESGDVANATTRKEFYKNLITKANSVPIIKIFKQYNINLNNYNRKITCPFPSHSGGKEHTPSMMYYPETNSFFCFGCKIGGQNSHGCEFISSLENISKISAAYKIIKLFYSDISDNIEINQEDFFEKLNIMLSFSEKIRQFRQNNFSEKSIIFIENISMIYDSLNEKHKLDANALRHVVDQLNQKIDLFE